jgi:exodeoxyribonuclease VII large subunit
LSATDVDVIVVTRGGGSVEDLWAFNDEALARAIFDCPVPVVTAIGHEIDTTLADLVADVRAPTPSAAAELIAPVLSELEDGLRLRRARLLRANERVLMLQRSNLRSVAAQLEDPRRQIGKERLRLSEWAQRIWTAQQLRVRKSMGELKATSLRLSRSRPQERLRVQKSTLRSLASRLGQGTSRRWLDERKRLSQLSMGLERLSPATHLAHAQLRLAGSTTRLTSAMDTRWHQASSELEKFAAQLEALSPLKVLGRGYSIVRRSSDGRVVRALEDAAVGDSVEIRHLEVEWSALLTKVKKVEK